LVNGAPATALLRATEFLHRDYKPLYYWWEVAALVQRTMLTGWLLLIDEDLKIMRLLSALMLSIGFLILIMSCTPYKRTFDLGLAAVIQVLFVCMFIGGILVRLYESILSDSDGSPELAYRLIGMRSTESVVTTMILLTFVMLVVFGATLALDARGHWLEARSQRRWSICTMDPPRVKQWEPRQIYACFLSHYKMEAAADARFMHDMLRKMLHVPVFLDSSALNDLRELVKEGVHKSESLVLLATKGVLLRPWCLLELLEATRHNVPVVFVQMSNGGFDFEAADKYLDNLEEEMGANNPKGLELLYNTLGDDLSDLQTACQRLLRANKYQAVFFDSHGGDNATVASMKELVERIARATGRNIKWKEGIAMQQTGSSSTFATLRGRMTGRKSSKLKNVQKHKISICLESYLDVVKRTSVLGELQVPKKAAASLVKSLSASLRLRRSSSRTSSRRSDVNGAAVEVNNPESASVFLCCSRVDAVLEARVLRSELQMKLNRACAIGGGKNTVAYVENSVVVIVLLTKRLLTDPVALFEIWKALREDVPLISIALTGKGYDFQEAAEAFADLPNWLEKAHAGSESVLQSKLPADKTVSSVGKLIDSALTSIIAIPWAAMQGRYHTDGVLNDICDRMPRRTGSARLARHRSSKGLKPADAEGASERRDSAWLSVPQSPSRKSMQTRWSVTGGKRGSVSA